MTSFEIINEYGSTAVLRIKDKSLPPTPWLFSVDNGFKLGLVDFHQIVLSMNGGLSIQKSNLNINWEIPNYSVITPFLTPIARNLEKSVEYELNLFLDRLDKCKLPEFFILMYNPAYHDKYLDELLKFKPSVIGIQFKDIDNIPIRDLIEIIIKLRARIPRNIAIYIPGGVSIGMQTLLISLGVDILDESMAYIKAARGFIFEDGFERWTKDIALRIRIKQNIEELQRDFNGILQSIANNNLWTRLAREMHVSTKISSAVTLINNKYINRINLATFPTGMHNKIHFTGDEGLYHPEIIAYRKRIIERYEVQNDKKVVLLLPCSARKPYRNSKSHMRFENTIGASIRHKRATLEIWSLTSPLGVVPRPIETLYPAANYDIPVTGDWSEEEIEVTGGMLREMITQLDNDVKIIAHVSSGYKGMIDFADDGKIIRSWIDDRPTSEKALQQLYDNLQQVYAGVDVEVPREKSLYKQARRDIPGLIQYVHGKDAVIDISGIRLVGRPPRPIQVQIYNEHFITWDQIKGEIRLSPSAAIKIANVSKNWVLLDTEKLSGSSVYAAGVFDASDEISPGDEVLLFNKNKTVLLGIGNAIISGQTMKQVNYGRVASLRKKINKEVIA